MLLWLFAAALSLTMDPERLTQLNRNQRIAGMVLLAATNVTLSYVSHFEKLPQHTSRLSGCYDKDLQTGFYLFKLGVLILES